MNNPIRENGMRVLAIESSCDETAAAVVAYEDGAVRICSNRVLSQIPLHARYGGVVPEIASRAHVEAISPLVSEALAEGGPVDAVCVTSHPGLIGALLVGVNFAKGYAFSHGLPLCEVDHIKGHVAANYFRGNPPRPPFLALVASGGHTSILKAESYTEYTVLGRTRDDAIGEVFDKVARVMGIPYPGGAEMDRLASQGDANAWHLPSAAIADGSLDFSFSGIKTAVINELNRRAMKGESYEIADVAASFTKTVTASVEKKLQQALLQSGCRTLVLAGGVAANSHLRATVTALAERTGTQLFLPPRELCGDNAAMIGAQGVYELLAGHRAGRGLNARPND